MADFDLTETERDGFIDNPDLKKQHARAISGFKISASFFADQRKREMEDLKFIDFDEQWQANVKAQRAGGQTVSGLPPTPARATITINQLRGPCQQVASQRRNARLGLGFAPKGGGAKQDLAEAYEDIVRAIQAESRANVARNWAADRAEKAGMGWYRIDTEYSLETPDDSAAWNDQDIVYRRVLNQASVYPDPFAQEPDFSDGRRLYVTQDLPVDIYRQDYPHSKMAGLNDSDLAGIGDAVKEFVFTAADIEGHQGQTVRVAECWEVVETDRRYVLLDDGSGAFEDEIPAGRSAVTGKGAKARRIKTRKVMWSKINAIEYLDEPQEWNGAYIPFVPVVWEESNVDGERRWTGIVRPGKEAAVSYNVMRSAQIQSIATATRAPWVGYMETIEPYLDWWKNASTRDFPILPIRAAKGPDGATLPPPQRNVAEPAIQAITLAAQQAKDDIHTTTGVPPVALGQLDPHERSGKAIQALQAQAETGSSGGLDNLVNISMAYEGKVLRDLIPRIFDRPGRQVAAIGIDEKRRMVMVNYPYIEGPDGALQPVPGWRKGLPIPPEAKYIDLAAGEVSVQPIVGKDYPTRREQASAAMMEVMKMLPPEMGAAIAPAMLEELDYPGARKIADIAKKSLPPQLAAAYEDDTSPNAIPPQAKAMIEQLQQQLQQAAQIIEGEQVKQQAETQRTMAKAQADAQTKLQTATLDAQVATQKAQIDADTRIAVAKINAQAGLTEASIKAGMADTGHQVAREEQLIGNDHELRVQAIDHEHERQQTAMQVVNSQVSEANDATEAERQRQHDAEMAAQASAQDTGVE